MAVHDTEPLPTAPYSPDVLAELHAGVLSPSVSSRLWPLVRNDPAAMVVITALDAVSAHLAHVGEDGENGMPVPPEVVERIDRALATERATVERVAANRVIPFRSRRSRVFGICLTVAAAAAVVAVAIAVVPRFTTQDTPSVQADPSLIPDAVDADLAYSIIGKRDTGPLSDPVRLSACLEANGIGKTAPVLGSSAVTIDGREGTLLILAGATPQALIALAVGDRCGVGAADTIARRDLN